VDNRPPDERFRDLADLFGHDFFGDKRDATPGAGNWLPYATNVIAGPASAGVIAPEAVRFPRTGGRRDTPARFGLLVGGGLRVVLALGVPARTTTRV
jgi:hypothetical protein